MIVLDEQLLGRNIEYEIASWYKGRVLFITELRPHTIIKDDVIPELLRQQNHPTFITINEKDFWRKARMNNECCIICFTLPDSHTHEIPQALRHVFQQDEFKTKTKRMGKIIRVTDHGISYYSSRNSTIRSLP